MVWGLAVWHPGHTMVGNCGGSSLQLRCLSAVGKPCPCGCAGLLCRRLDSCCRALVGTRWYQSLGIFSPKSKNQELSPEELSPMVFEGTWGDMLVRIFRNSPQIFRILCQWLNFMMCFLQLFCIFLPITCCSTRPCDTAGRASGSDAISSRCRALRWRQPHGCSFAALPAFSAWEVQQRTVE